LVAAKLAIPWNGRTALAEIASCPIEWRDITRVEVIMAKAYWVVTYRAIKNQDAFAAYAKLAGPAVQASGGRFIVRGAPAKTYEAGMNQRVVVIEFDSLQKALAAHDTKEYGAALEALGNGAERDIRIVEGVA
jgi:uncharacterized protein (DUF1330 family)